MTKLVHYVLLAFLFIELITVSEGYDRPALCYLPFKTGPCKASKPRFGFKNGECQQFIYGGCKGNENNFRTMEDCLFTCGCWYEETTTELSWLDYSIQIY